MRHDERGSALLIAMLMTLALAVLGATFLSVSLTDRKIAANEADATKAFAVTEAGIEDARAALATTTVNTLLAAGGHLFTGSTVGGGTYVVDVANNCCGNLPASTIVPTDAGGQFADTDQFLVLNATGTLKKASRRIQTVVRVPQGLFNYGVWCDTGGTFSGSSFMDAYDSTLGSYGGSNIAHDAGLFCNGGLNMSASSMIWGPCTVGDTSCDDPHVDGTMTENAPTETRTPAACPAGGYPASMPGTAGVTYTPASGVLKVSSNNMDLAVPPTSYYFSDLTVSGGGGSITLINPSNLHVDIYVSGKLTVSGGGFVNSAEPSKLTLWACGPDVDKWTISGGSDAHFAMYAPNREVTLSGGSPFFGAIVAGELVNSGGSEIHYDHALASSGIASVVARTWREIFP
jgi:Tfp pilus assembly protein PilX